MDSTESIKCDTERRGRRDSGSRGFAMMEGDIEILGLVLDHRFLQRGQVSALTGRHPKRLHRRLSKLEQHGYLTTLRFPHREYIYGLGRAGSLILVEQGRAEAELLEDRLRTHELTELFLKHEMMIVDIHVRLTLASHADAVRIELWKEGSELHDSVVAVDHKGSSRLPVRPDAFFSLLDSRRQEGANRANYMLEADRSTTTHTRFEDKIRAYWAYIEQGRHQQKFAIKGFRVLTVTLTDARAKNLSAFAASVLPERARKYFFFTPIGRLLESAEPFAERLCCCPRTPDELHALVPVPFRVPNEGEAL
jgi:hypothetical protein